MLRVSLHGKLPEASDEDDKAWPRECVARIVSGNGVPAFLVDLTEFAEGREVSRGSWQQGAISEPFRGRPRLARQLAETFQARYWPSNKTTAARIKDDLREFYRFLDSCDDGHMPVERLEDLGNSHTAAFKVWRDSSGRNNGVGSHVRRLLLEAAEYFNLEPLHWPALTIRRDYYGDLEGATDPILLKKLSSAICTELRGLKTMHMAAERLADEGCDPREFDVDRRRGALSPWRNIPNIAHLVRKFTLSGSFPDYATNTPLWHKIVHSIRSLSIDFEYRTPISPKVKAGLHAALLWFYPSQSEIKLFFDQFLIDTGWNVSTALCLDINNWVIDFPLKPNFKVLKSLKVRGSNSYQYALSGANAEFRPYQIVRYLIQRTEPLRAILRAELAELERLPVDRATVDEVEQHRARLLEAIRSPWLYITSNNAIRVSQLSVEGNQLRAAAREIARAHDIRDADGNVPNFTASDFRKSFAEFTYGDSGYQWLLSRIALGHADAAKLHIYLAHRRLRRHGFDQVRKFQDALFDEIGRREVVDPAALRLLVHHGKLTDEQRRRLIDARERTRVGMGCLNPCAPPRRIAPAHRGPGPCRVQRCTLCPFGVVFKDSITGLALRTAELLEIERRIAVETWLQSDYPEELESQKLALALFPEAQFRPLIEKFADELRTGERLLADVDPSY